MACNVSTLWIYCRHVLKNSQTLPYPAKNCIDVIKCDWNEFVVAVKEPKNKYNQEDTDTIFALKETPVIFMKTITKTECW